MCALVCAISLNAQTYYIAGNEASLFNKSWDPAGMALDQQTDGTWSKTFTTCGIGSEYQFKVTDGTWDNTWGYSELATVPEGVTTPTEGTGKNNIICTTYDANMKVVFDPTTKKITLTGVFQGTAEPQPLTYFLLHGNFTGDWANTNEFAISSDGATATLTLTLEAGDYEFGARIGSSSNWSASGETITRASNTADFNKKGGNNKMTADVAGEYVFTYTAATKILAVTYPANSGEGGEGGGDTPDPAATYGIGSNLNSYDPTANPMTVKDGVATCTIALGTETFLFSVVENGTTWLKNTTTPITRESNTVVLAAENNMDNTTLTPDVAGDYVFNFTIETKTLVVVFPAQEMGIQEVNTTMDCVKIIRNGQVLIVREGKTFDMMGQEVL
ncbi:MAG: hypothetical protein ACI30J_00960 [Paludibacteraceae bacterium]